MATKRLQFRLVSKKKNKRTGRQHVSSSSDGIVDYAAAVISGKMPLVGLPAVLPEKYSRRAKRLLLNNEVMEIAAKRTPRGDQQRSKIHRDLKRAFPLVIGHVYKEENKNKLSAASLLSTKTRIPWIKSSLETPNSRLNRELSQAGYDDLVELKRSSRWWLDALGLKNAE